MQYILNTIDICCVISDCDFRKIKYEIPLSDSLYDHKMYHIHYAIPTAHNIIIVLQ